MEVLFANIRTSHEENPILAKALDMASVKFGDCQNALWNEATYLQADTTDQLDEQLADMAKDIVGVYQDEIREASGSEQTNLRRHCDPIYYFCKVELEKSVPDEYKKEIGFI